MISKQLSSDWCFILPSNALVESKSAVTSRLIVRCGVPLKEDGEVVKWLGISVVSISGHWLDAIIFWGSNPCKPIISQSAVDEP